MNQTSNWVSGQLTKLCSFMLSVLLSSAACAVSAESAESGLGSVERNTGAKASIGGTRVMPAISVDPASTMVGASPAPALSCSGFPNMKEECVWWACKDGTCLAVQMCWRLTDDGQASCSFWDFAIVNNQPDPAYCCPSDVGQVVKVSGTCEP